MRAEGVYTIEILATIVGPTFQSVVVTTFELELTSSMCSASTVMTPPTPDPSYTYSIGDSLDIVLGWTADDPGCVASVATPIVSPTDTFGVFSFSADSLTNTVSTTDLASAGTYTVTTSASTSYWSDSVSYDVIVTDPCPAATFAIDSDSSTFPAGVGSVALTYTVSFDTDLDLAWNSGNDIVSSVSGTDPCGTIV